MEDNKVPPTIEELFAESDELYREFSKMVENIIVPKPNDDKHNS